MTSTIPTEKKKVTKDNVERATMIVDLSLDERETTFDDIQSKTVSKKIILIKEINMGLRKINFN
jgi:hypothetical protein